MKKILFVIGTRPEAIKMSPLILGLRGDDELCTFVMTTGQHTDTVYEVLNEFGIRIDYPFDVMKRERTLSEMGEAVLGITEDVLKRQKFDAVAVQGDTSSAFFAAVCAFHHKIPIIHIESGLRSNNIYSPFPEEANRRLIAQIATLNFAVDEYSDKNLTAENVLGKIFTVGNTVTDVFSHTLIQEWRNTITDRSYILITLHRRESRGKAMSEILHGIRDLAKKHADIDFVFPVHPSPYMQNICRRELCGRKNIILTHPLPITEFHNLLSRAICVISDSGGIQEEAAFLGVPIVVPRENTERERQLRAGSLIMCRRERESVISAVEYAMVCTGKRDVILSGTDVSGKIIEILKKEL
ncbi:MAG: UDP-N-acetylglucosamine 2-epimerase (non-hydrolyzing) [Eubacteriales bacterium]|nr:UDP-N-acetylglucosamine 2-epimerase (non-hydrolyzing) [Eubacteriales bacterium]